MLLYQLTQHLHNNKLYPVTNLLINNHNQLILFFQVYFLMEVECIKQLVGMDMTENPWLDFLKLKIMRFHYHYDFQLLIQMYYNLKYN